MLSIGQIQGNHFVSAFDRVAFLLTTFRLIHIYSSILFVYGRSPITYGLTTLTIDKLKKKKKRNKEKRKCSKFHSALLVLLSGVQIRCNVCLENCPPCPWFASSFHFWMSLPATSRNRSANQPNRRPVAITSNLRRRARSSRSTLDLHLVGHSIKATVMSPDHRPTDRPTDLTPNPSSIANDARVVWNNRANY